MKYWIGFAEVLFATMLLFVYVIGCVFLINALAIGLGLQDRLWMGEGIIGSGNAVSAIYAAMGCGFLGLVVCQAYQWLLASSARSARKWTK
jgi:hypothetical protein